MRILKLENTARAQSYGVEVAAAWQAGENWRLHANYTFLKLDGYRAAGITTSEGLPFGANPMHQASLHSAWNITPQWEFDLSANYVDAPAVWTSVESYVRLDAGLSWRPKKNMELSFGVQKILDNRHPEAEVLSLVGTVPASHIPRAFYGRFSYQF